VTKHNVFIGHVEVACLEVCAAALDYTLLILTWTPHISEALTKIPTWTLIPVHCSAVAELVVVTDWLHLSLQLNNSAPSGLNILH
jgi:hypothetical protein